MQEPVELVIRPVPRMSHAACLDSDNQDRIFIFGGSGLDIGKENYSDIWEFNPVTRKFNEIRQ